MGIAADERAALCDLFVETGPDAPTMCAGWQTRDLAAHLVVRERRIDAAPGILIRPLAGYTERVEADYATKPWGELVALVALGPGVVLADPARPGRRDDQRRGVLRPSRGRPPRAT